MDSIALASTRISHTSPQPRKLYIKIMQRTSRTQELEAQYLAYFRDFGPVEDLKILKNSALTRQVQIIRFRVVQGGSLGAGGAHPKPLTQRPRGDLTSSHSCEQWSRPGNRGAIPPRVPTTLTSQATDSSLGESPTKPLEKSSSSTSPYLDQLSVSICLEVNRTRPPTRGLGSSFSSGLRTHRWP